MGEVALVLVDGSPVERAEYVGILGDEGAKGKKRRKVPKMGVEVFSDQLDAAILGEETFVERERIDFAETHAADQETQRIRHR